MNEEGRIQELEWRIQGLLQEYADLEKRLKLLEDIFRNSDWQKRIQALEQTVRQLSSIHP